MNTEDKKLNESRPTEVPVGLFDRIILAIRREQESRKSRKLFFLFFILLIVSCVAAPFSGIMVVRQVNGSGILHFLSMIFTDLTTVVASWQDFSIAVLESLPLAGIIAFVLNIALALFTIRLFLHKKQLLLKYLMNNFNHNNLNLT